MYDFEKRLIWRRCIHVVYCSSSLIITKYKFDGGYESSKWRKVFLARRMRRIPIVGAGHELMAKGFLQLGNGEG